MIFFILSLSNDHQPFLIASTSESLSHWQAEFMRLAPSIDVVVYKGNIDTRSSIRALEFHEEDKDGIMLQVLLSPIEVVLEVKPVLCTSGSRLGLILLGVLTREYPILLGS